MLLAKQGLFVTAKIKWAGDIAVSLSQDKLVAWRFQQSAVGSGWVYKVVCLKKAAFDFQISD